MSRNMMHHLEVYKNTVGHTHLSISIYITRIKYRLQVFTCKRPDRIISRLKPKYNINGKDSHCSCRVKFFDI